MGDAAEDDDGPTRAISSPRESGETEVGASPHMPSRFLDLNEAIEMLRKEAEAKKRAEAPQISSAEPGKKVSNAEPRKKAKKTMPGLQPSSLLTDPEPAQRAAPQPATPQSGLSQPVPSQAAPSQAAPSPAAPRGELGQADEEELEDPTRAIDYSFELEVEPRRSAAAPASLPPPSGAPPPPLPPMPPPLPDRGAATAASAQSLESAPAVSLDPPADSDQPPVAGKQEEFPHEAAPFSTTASSRWVIDPRLQDVEPLFARGDWQAICDRLVPNGEGIEHLTPALTLIYATAVKELAGEGEGTAANQLAIRAMANLLAVRPDSDVPMILAKRMLRTQAGSWGGRPAPRARTSILFIVLALLMGGGAGWLMGPGAASVQNVIDHLRNSNE